MYVNGELITTVIRSIRSSFFYLNSCYAGKCQIRKLTVKGNLKLWTTRFTRNIFFQVAIFGQIHFGALSSFLGFRGRRPFFCWEWNLKLYHESRKIHLKIMQNRKKGLNNIEPLLYFCIQSAICNYCARGW